MFFDVFYVRFFGVFMSQCCQKNVAKPSGLSQG